MYNLANIYKNGVGEIKRNIKNAKQLYQKAMENGEIDAINNLAVICQVGAAEEGIEKDFHKAVELYKKAVEHGVVNAFYNLALIYHHGNIEQGFEIDIHKAIELYENAISRGNVASFHNIGNIYKDGIGGIKKDLHKAIEYYEKASSLGYQLSILILAQIYERGNQEFKIEKDLERACSLHFQNFDVHKDQISKESLLNLITHRQNQISWRKEYHVYWKKNFYLNKQIVLLLLISKFRREMNIDYFKTVLSKEIATMVIKYLCHLSPSEWLIVPPSNSETKKNPKKEKNCLIF